MLDTDRKQITIASHRVELTAQRRYETLPSMHTEPDDEDAACWWMGRGETAIFQTVVERRYQFPSRFGHGGTGYYALDADPAVITETARYTWTGKTWKKG